MIDCYELRTLADSCIAELSKPCDPIRVEALQRVIDICTECDGYRTSKAFGGVNKTTRIEMAHARICGEIDNQLLAWRAVMHWACTELAKNWWRRDPFAGGKVSDL